MSRSIVDAFYKSLDTGFVDKSVKSEVIYQPELLTNSKRPKKKVLSSIIHELNSCESFFISVAFVTTSGIATIINSLKSLDERGIKGKILVSQYLNFTQPEALRRLSNFKNIELKIATKENSHSKGYIFKTANYYNLIIGSSNLTASALATNKEWNLKVSALHSSSIAEKVIGEFKLDFEKGVDVTEAFIGNYETIYNRQRVLNEDYQKINDADSSRVVEPNSMQQEALKSLTTLRSENRDKALLISATGTGKTYLSAFDAKEFKPKRLLFVVHRLTIAKKAMETFQKVFSSEKSMGIYSGNRQELEKDFIFSTIQTISKESHLSRFNRDHFDYIIIDESHRSGARSYQRLVEFFNPRFLLGMTATPERTDGNDIFSLFDHNIAYEIRLNRAMEENMLSQFHYYGVTDITIDDKTSKDRDKFNQLITEDRVDKIVSNARFYGSDNGITRGLVFCSKNDEAEELSDKFNQRGYRTVALSGKNSEDERVEAINRLESDSISKKLDYIFTVDIFNEGVDIPKVNQILMMRPTNSAIIFIQQLGRGLRKANGKSYLTVIDFIGNYQNSYLIPIALYGDTSYNKDSLRRLLSEGSKMIPSASTINFDEITKERIFRSIDSANMQRLVDLKRDYNLLKFKLGRVPMMMDFIDHGERDPLLFANCSRSYYNFICKVDKNFTPELTEESVKLLELFSREINNAKRVEESTILKELITEGEVSIDRLKTILRESYGYELSQETISSCVRNINFEFIREKKGGKLSSVKEIYQLDIIELDGSSFKFKREFKAILENRQFRDHLLDSIEYSITTFNRNFDRESWHEGFVLYRKYTRKDVFRILNVAENPVSQNVGGYLVSSNSRHCPIFVNYHKEHDISESTKYEDKFISNMEFSWMSKSNRTLNSKDVKSILGRYGKIRLPLFIKKSNDEGKEFYFMGDVTPDLNRVEQTEINSNSGGKAAVVKIRFNFKEPVSDSIYNYLTHNSLSDANIPESSIESIESIENVDSEILESNSSNKKSIEPKKSLIPLYDFYAAAGGFSEMQSEKDFKLIEVPERYSSRDEYFTCKIKGESMNRVIPNGSICLFKKYRGGSRGGKIVLVENFDYQDPDFNSAFTIKTYSSEKFIDEDGWQHKAIALRPNSFDTKYKSIAINEDNGAEMRIVGEFIEVIDTEK